MPSCSSRRLPAEQVWPAFCTIAAVTKGRAASASASSNTSCGDLPPSSIVTGRLNLRRRGLDRGAGGGRPGEADVVEAGMRGQGRPGLGAQAGDDVQRARRQPGLQRQPGDAQRRQAGILGRLQHAGIAGGQRAADGAAEDLRRVVPRDDVAGDAVGLLHRQHGVAVEIGQGGAVMLVAGAAVELEIAGAGGDVGLGLLHRLAGIGGLEPPQRLEIRLDGAADAGQDAAALDRRHPAPGPVVEGPARGPTAASISAAPPRARLSNAAPVDGSITGIVRPSSAPFQIPSIRIVFGPIMTFFLSLDRSSWRGRLGTSLRLRRILVAGYC